MKISNTKKDWLAFMQRVNGDTISHCVGQAIGKTPVADSAMLVNDNGVIRCKIIDLARVVMTDTILPNSVIEGEGWVNIEDVALFIRQLGSFSDNDRITVEYPFQKNRVGMYNDSKSVEYDFPHIDDDIVGTSCYTIMDSQDKPLSDNLDFLSDEITCGKFKAMCHFQVNSVAFKHIENDASVLKQPVMKLEIDGDVVTIGTAAANAKMNVKRRLDVLWVAKLNTSICNEYLYGLYLIPKHMAGDLDVYLLDNGGLLVSDGQMGVCMRRSVPDHELDNADEYADSEE